MGDLIGFEGYLNTTTPFSVTEHPSLYKTSRQYSDFSISNEYNATCQYPRFWNETGFPVDESVTSQLKGCYNSDFDQYGDTEAFGVYPDWRRQLTKFASVQDRLREWHPPVRAKIENFYCMLISQLDIDGFRYDKALQATVDALSEMNLAMRQCAKQFGKENFFLAGEITGGNDLASVWLGRGRQPDQVPTNITEAVTVGFSTQNYSIRDPQHSALDGAAFHYSVYRSLTRFLGMDGNLEAGYDTPLNFVDLWNTLLTTNDMTNPNTGEFDPRHMYGTMNQDLFRWPAIQNGLQRQLLANFITTLMLPGIPLLLWGEEQAFYVLDNTASNYIFGRQPLSSASAWQTHGCYSLDSTQYYQWPVESAKLGCHDDTVSYDHRDPSAPARNIFKHMYHLRYQFPVLQDGAWLQQLSNQTVPIIYPGSSGVVTETGMWSVVRSGIPNVQNFTTTTATTTTTTGDDESFVGQGNTPVWLLFSNKNVTTQYHFNCSDTRSSPETTALLSPFDAGTSVRNLLYPFDVVKLGNSSQFLGISGSVNASGCLGTTTLDAYGFKAYVPVQNWVGPKASITRFVVNGVDTQGHDARLLSQTNRNLADTVHIQFYFSVALDCDSVTRSISIASTTTVSGLVVGIDESSIVCNDRIHIQDADLQGMIPSAWSWSAKLYNVADGIHKVTVGKINATTEFRSKKSMDHFLFRIGQADNPIVFPRMANYSTSLVQQGESSNSMYLYHSAAGADLWRYTTNWGSTYSPWMPYTGENTSITDLTWSGTDLQAWKGTHVVAEYFSRMAGSSDTVQEGDLDTFKARRFPHLFWNGPYNEYGYDSGIINEFHQLSDGDWQFDFMTEWPAIAQVNVWGLNPDGNPDHTYIMGDIDSDSVLDRMPPSALAPAVINITAPPAMKLLYWRVSINDGTRRFVLTPLGSSTRQLILFVLLCVVPIFTAGIAIFAYMRGFYQVKFNQYGAVANETFLPTALEEKLRGLIKMERSSVHEDDPPPRWSQIFSPSKSSLAITDHKLKGRRRTVLIGTMEYDIEDWKIKVKIGGLGVMAQLMGKALGHQDLIWVVPCIGGVEYPTDTPAEPMKVTILGVDYAVQVQYHQLNNIKYVLLDAPVFRQQTQQEPYPARMDDLASAIYYSAWNQCIAQAMRRFPIDLYHINDYHGCIAPLYLLPQTFPVCMSLHNAEFQGLWPMRTLGECAEVSKVFNLTSDVVQKFVQYGQVFNLLHAGASYLRVYQQGFGAVGVSKKYGKRAHLRYPIFWGLKKIGQLPNPDPTDNEVWNGQICQEQDMQVDPMFEAARPLLRLEAQRWAGLEEDSDAELFVFVGRWSKQKGVDLIADIFPTILKKHPKTQLICVGPVIDLYGKFAALKLDKLMKKYPKRVFSKPVFTALPPCIFSGAEFALIPSRDEPFGLVAVEFGRKGALGVGSRVGGLGNMPGWWYTVEAVSTSHLLGQFRQAIEDALSSKQIQRATMRARSAKQRFPVAQWVEDLDILQSTSIRLHGSGDAKEGKSVYIPPRSTSYGTTSDVKAMLISSSSNNTVDEEASAEGQDEFDDDLSPPSTPLPFAMSNYAKRMQSTNSVNSITIVDGERQRVSFDMHPATLQHSQGPSRVSSPILRPGSSQSFASIIRPDSAQSFVSCPSSPPPPRIPTPGITQSMSFPDGLPLVSSTPLLLPRSVSYPNYISDSSPLASGAVIGDKKDYCLQQVDSFFNDSQGIYCSKFEKVLEKNDAIYSSNSCIEEYLVKSEKEWFSKYLNAKLGREETSSSTNLLKSRPISRATSMIWSFGSRTPGASSSMDMLEQQVLPNLEIDQPADEFPLGDTYKFPRYLRKWVQLRMGDWPVYSLLLAVGQIMAANSYQITLLTGQIGEAAERVYILCAIYMVSSIMFWILFRKFQSVTVLTIPFVLYGIAFSLLGIARFGGTVFTRGWLQNVATGFYTIASASGSLYFSLNFGDEGGSTVQSWIFRACLIQGFQQVYVTALWFWGANLNQQSSSGSLRVTSNFINSWKVTAICIPIACALWVLAFVVYVGLPNYYRQIPGRIPSFYSSVLRRKIILWFFLTVLIQNFFLSSQYGRSWSFLWNSQHVPKWQIACLVVFFFIILWAAMLWGFSIFTKSHSWLLPMLAVGLGAPRWAQIWWAVSDMGTWMPWTNGYIASALLSRSLWLWLGLLDTIQSVGIGMILLSTMTRVHIAFTLLTAQVIGAAMTAISRGFSPARLGPGPIFPNILVDIHNMFNAWFWIGLIMNGFICIGFFMFFRKEQLNKP